MSRISIMEKGKGGLSGVQVTNILGILRQAKNKGVLPPLSYQYNPRTKLFGRDPLYVRPKSGSVMRVGVKVRNIIREKFGAKYSVRIV